MRYGADNRPIDVDEAGAPAYVEMTVAEADTLLA